MVSCISGTGLHTHLSESRAAMQVQPRSRSDQPSVLSGSGEGVAEPGWSGPAACAREWVVDLRGWGVVHRGPRVGPRGVTDGQAASEARGPVRWFPQLGPGGLPGPLFGHVQENLTDAGCDPAGGVDQSAAYGRGGRFVSLPEASVAAALVRLNAMAAHTSHAAFAVMIPEGR